LLIVYNLIVCGLEFAHNCSIVCGNHTGETQNSY